MIGYIPANVHAYDQNESLNSIRICFDETNIGRYAYIFSM